MSSCDMMLCYNIMSYRHISFRHILSFRHMMSSCNTMSSCHMSTYHIVSSCYLSPCHFILSHPFTSCHPVTSCYIMSSCHIISSCHMSSYVILLHVISCHASKEVTSHVECVFRRVFHLDDVVDLRHDRREKTLVNRLCERVAGETRLRLCKRIRLCC